MPSKNMLPKGQRRRTVKHEYRVARTAANEQAEAATAAHEAAVFDALEDPEEILGDDVEDGEAAATAEMPEEVVAAQEDAGKRIDAVLAKRLPEVSRARVQMWIERGAVTVDGVVARASHKLRAGERVKIEGDLRPVPLKAEPENIPLDVVHEDKDLAVINKPAGMMVHAGNGATDDARHKGTLVNAILYHFKNLSEVGGELRPGIVHRLDKETSGLIVVAKNDVTHRKLAEMFSARTIKKTYIALVHGVLEKDSGTISSPIARDQVRRTRMKALLRNDGGGRNAISHYRVMERLATPWGKFTLVEVKIETGRTHQIRVHMSSIGHAVVGDTLYGAPREMQPAKNSGMEPIGLKRNFLHAARLEFVHPSKKQEMRLDAPLPPELKELLDRLRSHS